MTAPIARLGGAGTVLPAAAVGVWTSGYLAGALATNEAGALAVTFWRFLAAALLFALAALVTRARWPRRPRAWAHLAVTGILLQAVQFGCVYLGLAHGVSAGFASLIISVSPLVTAAAGTVLLRERMRPLAWIGLALGLAGVTLAVGDGLLATRSAAGVVLVVVGMLGFAAGSLYQKRFGATIDLRSGTAIQYAAAALTVLPMSLATGGFGLPASMEMAAILAWLVVVNSVGGVLVLFVLLRRRSSGDALGFLYLVPGTTALLAVPVLGQGVSWPLLAGLALSLVGTVLLGRARTVRRPDRVRPTPTTRSAPVEARADPPTQRRAA